MQRFNETQVKNKMAELGVFGYSSMGEFEPDDVMARLLDLERLYEEETNALTAYKKNRPQPEECKDVVVGVGK